ncbi:LuxR family transcriptional regulator [Xenorhabdus vietnamensis]|uniref:LuxR family transcriptional regulator n=1 Tax=Xenorhabdus vietnamensis TaxID=351656 RepID=A0A1Y2SLB8_9GAMM|nr:PAS domain-containing protein [Xenorhabdus vietnamensis]OTA18361.1 LuxR family transcriptional regulator [Xenorhabdus vietnamensis]
MKKPNNITPQLIHMWEKSLDPWGAKDHQSRFIYANPVFYQLLDLPENSDITGLNIGELPSSLAEYEEELYYQEQKVIQTMQRVTSIETHPFGKHKVKKAYICDKHPLFDDNGNCIGTTFHMYKIPSFSVSYYYDKVTPATLEFTPPNNILTQIEWEIIFLILHSLDEKNIVKELMINTKDFIKHTQSICQKFNLSQHIDLKKFCREQKFDRYIPERFITIGSRELN